MDLIQIILQIICLALIAGDIYKDPMFNPIAQYEQAYTYYKYLCMQMDYKIKCKEYEKLCQNTEHRQ